MDKKTLQSIDEEIRPLVAELNRVGLITAFSCQGHEPERLGEYDKIYWETDSRAYISFDIENIKNFEMQVSKNCEGRRLLSIYWDRTQ